MHSAIKQQQQQQQQQQPTTSQWRVPSLLKLKSIIQLSLVCTAAFFLSQTLLSNLFGGHFQAGNLSTSQSNAHIFVTRSDQNIQSNVWLSILQALSKATHLQTTIIDIKEDQSRGRGRDASLEELVDDIFWRKKPLLLSSSADASSTEVIISKLNNGRNVLMTTSCATDLLQRPDYYLQLLNKTKIILYCTVGDAKPFLPPSGDLVASLLPWAKQSRLQFISLSDHISQLLDDEWSARAPFMTTRVFPPIFHISDDLLHYDEINKNKQLNKDNGTVAIVEEDSFGSETMGNSTLMNEALERFSTSRLLAKKESSRLGNAIITQSAWKLDAVEKPSSLPMKNFNKLSNASTVDTLKALASSVVVVPVANEEDRIAISSRRASTIIPLAIIAGVPPVVDEATFAGHSYLDRDSAVILSQSDITRLQSKLETVSLSNPVDMMRAFDYLAIPDFQQARKRQAVETLRTTILVQNTYKLQAWVLQDTA